MVEGEQIFYRPTLADLMLEWVCALTETLENIPLLGVSGAQGIGKTTSLANVRASTEPKVAILSLDDFYLPQAERLKLAEDIHPLCVTRGAPGTHDVRLLKSVISQLRENEADGQVMWPSFDKAADDRNAEVHWNSFTGRPDAILVEGWLLGALCSPELLDNKPVNALEAESDSKGLWRQWQIDSLRSDYEPLWQDFDAFLHLRAPNFEVVKRWRCEQEETTLGFEKGALPAKNRDWVVEFVQYYERLTECMLAGHLIGGTVFELDESRSVKRLING